MEKALNPRQQARFKNANSSVREYKKNIDTPLAVAECLLSEGIKNSVEEFSLVMSSRLNAVNEEDIAIECTPIKNGCEILVIVPAENTLGENIVKRLFHKYVVDKTIEHPYGMPWQRTSNKTKLSYTPSVHLENIDVDDSEGNIVIMARIGFKFE